MDAIEKMEGKMDILYGECMHHRDHITYLKTQPVTEKTVTIFISTVERIIEKADAVCKLNMKLITMTLQTVDHADNLDKTKRLTLAKSDAMDALITYVQGSTPAS